VAQSTKQPSAQNQPPLTTAMERSQIPINTDQYSHQTKIQGQLG
jgi:hypothetical protein